MATSEALTLGLQYHQAGQLTDATRMYQRVLADTPDHPHALHLLGLLAHRRGDSDLAAELIARAISVLPVAPFHCNLGYVLLESGRWADARPHFEQALALQPEFVEAMVGLANALRQQGQLAEAAAHYETALGLQPDLPKARLCLGVIRQSQGKLDEAIAHYRHAEAIEPNNFDVHLNLGEALRLRGQLHEALASCQRAVQLDPEHFGAHLNLGLALGDLGRLDESFASCQRSLSLNPDAADAHLALGLVALRRGDFETGWREYEWRWQAWEIDMPAISQPLWDGSPLAGRTLLLQAEQGLGDTLQFVRYVPLLQQQTGRVILRCEPELKRLLAHSLEVEVVANDEPAPDFDVYVPLLSLPYRCGTTLETIPASVPYLRIERDLSAYWRRRLAGRGQRKVGLVWASRPNHRTSRLRSLNPGLLAPLAAIPGVQWFSLQKGATPDQSSMLPAEMSVIHLGPDLNDFADTAAVVAELDLLISIDTSAAHLAGALGRPVWLLLPFVSDWRWLLDRENSPWYPTMRLFRQDQPGGWEDVICRAASCLAAELQNAPVMLP